MTDNQQSTTPAPGRRPILRWILAGLAVIALLIVIPVLFLMGGSGSDDPDPTPTTGGPTSSVPTAVVGYPLYFLADYVQASNKPGPHLVPVRRSAEIASNASLIDEIRAAVLALIEGPVAEDGIEDLSTSIPAETQLLGLVVDQTTELGTVSVDFDSTFAAGAGTFSVASRIAQVVFTITAFDGIDEVVFLIDGEEVDVFSSEGLVLDGPQGREQYEDFLPLMLVEWPLAGAEVTSPLTVTGIANAFEASVSIRAEQLDGTVLAETFTTATCGTGCYGLFSEPLEFTVTEDTAGRIVAFEASANDGSMVNVFEVPVTFVAGDLAGPTIRSYDVDVADLRAEQLAGTAVVNATYGTEAGQVGRGLKDGGPCCFDVARDGSIVVLDAENTRVLKFDQSGGSTVLAEFDPADFVPDAIAAIEDRVIVVGLTQRPANPYDAIAYSLSDGTLIKRIQLAKVDMNGDLRSTDEGVFWSAAASAPVWVAVADADGDLIDSPSPLQFSVLPARSSIGVVYDAGVEVTVRLDGNTAVSVFDVIDENSQFADVLGAPSTSMPDGVVVILGAAFDDSGIARVTVLELGTPPDGLLAANAFEFTIERATDTGSFNTFRYGPDELGNPALYAMSTTETGLEIVRYHLN